MQLQCIPTVIECRCRLIFSLCKIFIIFVKALFQFYSKGASEPLDFLNPEKSRLALKGDSGTVSWTISSHT